MPPSQKTLSHKDYTIGWICALPLEMAAAKAMLDNLHPKLQQPPPDQNAYALGEVSGHNVVIACLPSGVMGTVSSAAVATRMLSTFPRIQFGLLVGIGGGVPSPETDVRLGDIVVSYPRGTHTGVVQYDYGKAIKEGRFERMGSLNKPPQVLLTAVSDLQSNHLMGLNRIPQLMAEMVERYPAMSRFSHPGKEDILFEAGYGHDDDSGKRWTWHACKRERVVLRDKRDSSDPRIHYGLIASGNQVMKDGRARDRLARELGIICFEMEAAGLMDQFPCLVIRGICDYADSHKNKDWQEYAAAVAAAYAKELLSNIATSSQMEDGELGQTRSQEIDIISLDPTLDNDRETLYRLFRSSLPKEPPARDESSEEPLKVTLLSELLTWKFHHQGPWNFWLDRYAVDGYNLNVRDGWGKTPLHYAVSAKENAPAKVRKLVEKGADVTMADYEGNTPVDDAQRLGDTTLLSLMLKSWVEVRAEDASSTT